MPPRVMSRPYRAKFMLWRNPVALPRAGMFSPFRAGRGREVVERAGGGDHVFATTEWTQRSG